MFFNSIDFALFLPVVFALYWLLNKGALKVQNFFIVIASYVFYGWWDWRFLALMLFSTTIDFIVCSRLASEEKRNRRLIYLWISLVFNLGLLGFFKYFNFFQHNFARAFTFFGMELEPTSLSIVLPVGISFYTFQTLSYTIDVYKKRLTPSSDFIAFAAFVSFFPQLVAGPIERATNLLPQFLKKRKFEYTFAVDGLRQILWGLFKKIVIADNCARIVNQVFENSSDLSGSTLFLGAVLFAFQIYGDFSGYSDIAIGTSKLFGFKLQRNFAFPYFSRSIAEFWRRWHISLSTWFKDYLYIPLGGSKGGLLLKVRNTFIIFIVSGFWHGANWTFLFWGAINALYFVPSLLLGNNRLHLDTVAEGKLFPSLNEFLRMLFTFVLVVFGWVFFRAVDIGQAFGIFKEIFSYSFFTAVDNSILLQLKNILFFLSFLLVIEWLGRDKQYAIEYLMLSWKRPLRWGVYSFLIFAMVFYGADEQGFIYFQF